MVDRLGQTPRFLPIPVFSVTQSSTLHPSTFILSIKFMKCLLLSQAVREV